MYAQCSVHIQQHIAFPVWELVSTSYSLPVHVLIYIHALSPNVRPSDMYKHCKQHVFGFIPFTVVQLCAFAKKPKGNAVLTNNI